MLSNVSSPTDPLRNPESQALVFPPENPDINALRVQVFKLNRALTDLVRFIEGLPKPAGMNNRLTEILQDLNS